MQNFRGKNTKDVEMAEESLISNSSFITSINNTIKAPPKLNITYQQQNNEDFDDFLEKKK
jgi:hypothetical protein